MTFAPRHSGLTWLHAIAWPVDQVVLDGELYQGTGMDGIDSVLRAREGDGGDLALAVFDVLEHAILQLVSHGSVEVTFGVCADCGTGRAVTRRRPG